MNKEKDKRQSALKVQDGIDQPSSINPSLSKGLDKFKKSKTDVNELVNGILKGDRSSLSRAITIIESSLSSDKIIAREIIQSCLPHSGKSIRIGVTGVPGVGKSTFIESFGNMLIKEGKKVAVLAIDPSSKRTKGSILGDKTRMESLSVNDKAFIRPSASAGTLGGVARKTRETITLCEAAGFDIILVETVGVGQSEVAVAQIVDFFLLLMLAGSGDELQGIKRGIMEMADMIMINKADGDNINKANLAKREFENALHLFPALKNQWIPKVTTASALMKNGIDNVWKTIAEYVELTKSNGHFDLKRSQQSGDILRDTLESSLMDDFYNTPGLKEKLDKINDKISKGLLNPYDAAEELLNIYRKS
ncbi:MAG: methylmalonyl Co-A mutase-associated GTPase MeaB [Marinilabiliales bacterium]|nr:MAG: methylmalonyl Co-A mutase-associated GTPase MeaB [Marinilabiliales bacterium]